MQLLRAQERRLRRAVKHGWSRLVSAARPRYRVAVRARQRHFSLAAASAGAVPPGGHAVDLVALTILAVNKLGPATLRTVAHGRPVTINVPDARTGEIFRAALAQMQKARTTDRLITIVIDEAAEAAS